MSADTVSVDIFDVANVGRCMCRSSVLPSLRFGQLPACHATLPVQYSLSSWYWLSRNVYTNTLCYTFYAPSFQNKK